MGSPMNLGPEARIVESLFDRSPLVRREEDLRWLSERADLVRFPPGRFIPGTHRDECFSVVVSGRVERLRIAEDGREITLGLMSTGDCFDVLRVLGQGPSPLALRPLDEVVVAAVPYDRVRQRMEVSAPFADALFAELAEREDVVSRHVSELVHLSTQTRLALLLTRNLETPGPGIPTGVADLSHGTLARLIGTVREVVSRHLAQWRREGIVKVENGQITIVDHVRVCEMADPAG